MPWSNAIELQKRKHWIWAAIVLVLIVAGFAAWPRVRHRYDRWSAKRSIELARDCYAKGDHQHAMLNAWQALKVNPMDPDACRIVAQVLEAAGSPLAMKWRMQLDFIVPGDPENLLAWGRSAAAAGDWETAERVIQGVKPADQNDARYHDIMAALAVKKDDLAEAELHWVEAVRLDPREDRYRLNLAAVRLKSKDSDVRAAALGVLEELVAKGSQSIPARRVLLREALGNNDAWRSKGLADALVAAPGATLADKLLRLSILRVTENPEAASYLAELREGAKSSPNDLAELFEWMNGNALAMMVSEWAATMPADVVSKPPVCMVVAESCILAADWKKLRAMTEKGNWMAMDYLRRAFLARALERLGEAEAGTAEWKEALAAAHSSPAAPLRLDRLARKALEWGWEARAEELLWDMAGYESCPPWALGKLWTAASRTTDTAKLHKLSRAIAKAKPKDPVALNSYVFLSLLTRTQEGNPHKVAEALFKEHPDNSHIVATYALSLYQQGRPGEAVQAMSELTPEQLRERRVALCYGIALMAAGKLDKAREYIDLGSKGPLLPEEKAMLDRAKLEAGKAAEESSVAETSKAMRATKAAKEAAEEKELAEAIKAARDAKAAMDIEKEKAVEAARAARATRAAQEAAEAAAKKAAEQGAVPK